MFFPGRSPAHAGVKIVLFLTAVMLFIGSPAAAALVITNESFSPVQPLVAGSGQHTVIMIAVIPAGATTFSRTHTLQMQTALADARWNIRITVDGIPAARQSASGTTAFVNGYLLSYPTTSDVSFTVTLDGIVPSGAETNVTILQLTELDRAGTPVPVGSLTVCAPLIAPSPGTVKSPQVTAATPPAATAAPTRSPGLLPVTCLVASLVAAAVYGYTRVRR